jgi:outer membrane protein OmpA-like peptidoglycan-associated protein
VPPDAAPSPRHADRSTPRTPWLALTAAAVVVPTVLAGLTLLWPRPQIESTLVTAAESALSAAGISGATVRFDGRDATVSGVSDAAAAQAVRAVEAATGVRAVRVASGEGQPGTAGGGAGAPSAPAQAQPGGAAGGESASAPAETGTAGAGATPTASGSQARGGELDAAAKQALQAKITALVTAAPITFGPDSPQLTSQGRAALARVLAAVRAAPGARLEIDGYVASGPGNGVLTAQQLSAERAATVRDAFVAGGVPAANLTAQGRGEDTATTDRALARRVEITVV